MKHAIPKGLCTRVVYKFSCVSCNTFYVGETSRHFATRVHEHLFSERYSHVHKHLLSSESCLAFRSPDCFQILDYAATKYRVALEESIYIKLEKPNLNQQVKHINLTPSLKVFPRLLFKRNTQYCEIQRWFQKLYTDNDGCTVEKCLEN